MLQMKTPRTYFNEYNLLASAGEIIAKLSRRVILITGNKALTAVQSTLLPSLSASGIEYQIEFYSGKTTLNDIRSYLVKTIDYKATAVVGIGGGKVMDLVKAVAEDAKLPVITIPTIASNCASWTSLTVLYDEDGRHLDYRRLDAAPNLILADATILLSAPKRYIAAGMGDTIAKWLEAYNFFSDNYASVNEQLGVFLAKKASDIIKTYYSKVYDIAGHAQADGKGPDFFIEVLDAVFFLAGLIGSLRGGKHVAAYIHPLNDTFTLFPQVQAKTHGEVVAFANAVQLVLFRQSDQEIEKLLQFNQALSLPISLYDLGFSGSPEVAAHKIANAFDFDELEDDTTPYSVDSSKLKAALLKTHYLGIALTEKKYNPITVSDKKLI